LKSDGCSHENPAFAAYCLKRDAGDEDVHRP
jgi:hypothetical protein